MSLAHAEILRPITPIEPIPQSKEGHVYLWRAIRGPVRPSGESTFASHNNSLAQPYDLGDIGGDNPFLRVEGLPVFLNPWKAKEWHQRSYGHINKEDAGYILGGVAVVGCAQVPVRLFEDGIISVHSNSEYSVDTGEVPYMSIIEGQQHDGDGGGDDFEHYVPSYPSGAGIDTEYYLFDRYNLDGSVAPDTQLMPYTTDPTVPFSVPSCKEAPRPRVFNDSEIAAQMRDFDPYSTP